MPSKSKALLSFINTINACGGVFKDSHGLYCPVGDPAWVDSGEAYVKACEETGQSIKESPDPT